MVVVVVVVVVVLLLLLLLPPPLLPLLLLPLQRYEDPAPEGSARGHELRVNSFPAAAPRGWSGGAGIGKMWPRDGPVGEGFRALGFRV